MRYYNFSLIFLIVVFVASINEINGAPSGAPTQTDFLDAWYDDTMLYRESLKNDIAKKKNDYNELLVKVSVENCRMEKLLENLNFMEQHVKKIDGILDYIKKLIELEDIKI